MCDDLVYFNATMIQCRGLNASLGFTTGSIVVTVEGQAATSSVFKVKDGPSIDRVVPQIGTVDGGYVISVQGTNLGQRDADVRSVTIGGRPCTDVARDSAGTWVNCTAPPGVGARVSLGL